MKSIVNLKAVTSRSTQLVGADYTPGEKVFGILAKIAGASLVRKNFREAIAISVTLRKFVELLVLKKREVLMTYGRPGARAMFQISSTRFSN